MKRIIYFTLSLTLLCGVLLSLNNKIMACESPVPLSPAMTYLYVIKNADVIVRATAVESVEIKSNGFVGVKFKVDEVLKGDDIPSTLTFFGHLTDRDNYNNRPVPYQGISPSGNNFCYAQDYKRGAEFLLLLRKDKSKIIDPYWKPYAPTNEQLHPENDAWLNWVRNNLN